MALNIFTNQSLLHSFSMFLWPLLCCLIHLPRIQQLCARSGALGQGVAKATTAARSVCRMLRWKRWSTAECGTRSTGWENRDNRGTKRQGGGWKLVGSGFWRMAIFWSWCVIVCPAGGRHVVISELYSLCLCEGKHRVSAKTVCTNHQLPLGEWEASSFP